MPTPDVDPPLSGVSSFVTSYSRFKALECVASRAGPLRPHVFAARTTRVGHFQALNTEKARYDVAGFFRYWLDSLLRELTERTWGNKKPERSEVQYPCGVG